jgi:hypothetical protein
MPPPDWHERNTAFLANSVGWVRASLEALAANERPPKRPVARGDKTSPPALFALAARLGLSQFEQDVLLLCTATATATAPDVSLSALCAKVSGDPTKPYPTFALAMRLFPEAPWEALAPSSALRRWRLIEIHQAANEPLIASALRADERIVHFLKGRNEIDDRVEGWVRALPPASEASLPPSLTAQLDRIEASMRGKAGAGRPVIQLLGPNAATKKELAAALSARLARGVWRLSAGAVAALGTEWDAFARLLLREAVLLDAILYLDCEDTEVPVETAPLSLLVRFLDRLEAMPVIVAGRDPLVGLDRPSLNEFVDKPTASEQRAAWLRLLGAKRESVASRLAGQFNLDISTIECVAASPQAKGAAVDDDTLWRRAREAVRPRVLGLAERIDSRAVWNDLVLPDEKKHLLEELAEQVPHQWTVYEHWGFGRRLTRGLGIGALFSGGSGTGKTMAAEVIANKIGLDLYRIDLASVVSKYIGETEKNLRRVFDAFEDGGAILFFDEADALFGKRSEVKDSHDRYANIEVNYLLQRMEAYRGLVILATNRQSALDSAFLRRLRFIVDFPYPREPERRKIWQGIFPPETPHEIGDSDWDRLARLGLSGGNIQSVALNAAFRAASSNRKVNLELIFSCARAEFIKLGEAINEADFRLDQDRPVQGRGA